MTSWIGTPQNNPGVWCPASPQVNHLEKQLNYPFNEQLPLIGEPIEIAPGKLWVRMPLPFALDHINLWLLRDHHEGRDGWTLVDTGVGLPATREAWETIFSKHLGGKPIVRVICTHCHPDHFGNADWIGERYGSRVWMSQGDFMQGRLLFSGQLGADGLSTMRHFMANGLNDEQCIAELSSRKMHFIATVPSVPQSFHRLVDADVIEIGGETWRVITGYGHSPEHLALYNAKAHLLISGDMLLPRISTNIAVHAVEPESNPLQQFMDSIQRFLLLPPETMVLPSHGRPFTRLHVRVQQYLDHHLDRLAEVSELCASAPATAAHVVPIMFKRKLDTHQMVFALGEALAHLHKLWYTGELVRERDAAGVFHFRPSKN
jgi:glyoxylase-like metal-dependent hydrolase (beta-lactamase superfamily II)